MLIHTLKKGIKTHTEHISLPIVLHLYVFGPRVIRGFSSCWTKMPLLSFRIRPCVWKIYRTHSVITTYRQLLTPVLERKNQKTQQFLIPKITSLDVIGGSTTYTKTFVMPDGILSLAKYDDVQCTRYDRTIPTGVVRFLILVFEGTSWEGLSDGVGCRRL